MLNYSGNNLKEGGMQQADSTGGTGCDQPSVVIRKEPTYRGLTANDFTTYSARDIKDLLSGETVQSLEDAKISHRVFRNLKDHQLTELDTPILDWMRLQVNRVPRKEFTQFHDAGLASERQSRLMSRRRRTLILRMLGCIAVLLGIMYLLYKYVG